VEDLLSVLWVAGIILVVWSLVAVAAVFPLARLFRRRALANDQQARQLDRALGIAGTSASPGVPDDVAADTLEGVSEQIVQR
jgi:Flp pilus assembly protein TadB